MKLFDHYSFRARLQPALFTLLPAAIGIFAWTGPGVKWQSALWTLFGTVGGTFFLGILARSLGKQIEPGLWQSWGGPPTTQLLRHSGSGNPVLRERWHKCLSKLLGQPLPTAEEEAADPVSADEAYRAGTKLLINKTRDVKKVLSGLQRKCPIRVLPQSFRHATDGALFFCWRNYCLFACCSLELARGRYEDLFLGLFVC